MPAQAIITPLSVHNFGGGNEILSLYCPASLVNAPLIALLAADPPDTTWKITGISVNLKINLALNIGRMSKFGNASNTYKVSDIRFVFPAPMNSGHCLLNQVLNSHLPNMEILR
jgi:hypothetical protein